MSITTNLKKLYESTAMKERVDTLARGLGGIVKYGAVTPITMEQIEKSNGRADREWVEEHTSVHLNGAEPQAAVAGNETVETNDVSKAVQEAFNTVLDVPGADITTTTNKKEKTMTATIKVKCEKDSPIAKFLESL